MASPRTVVAGFTAPPVTIAVSVNPASGGSVSGGGVVAANSQVTLVATPSAGYTFTNWTENGAAVSTSASYTFTATANRTLVANFSQSPVTIAVTANPTAGGAVSGDGTYAPNTSVTVTATPNPGYTFTNWTESGTVVSTSASYTFAATANRTLVANFALGSYTITVSANPASGGTVSGGGTFVGNSVVTVNATPSTGYVFAGWSENGSGVSSSATYTFPATANRALASGAKNCKLKIVN